MEMQVSTVTEDMQQTVQQLKMGKHEEAQRYERELDLLKVISYLCPMDTAAHPLSSFADEPHGCYTPHVST